MSKASDRAAAEAKYEEFHRFKPRKIGEFAEGFSIPTHVYRGGAGKWVTYRSDKVDPATLKMPREPVDYIHEHDSHVGYYFAKKGEHAHERVAVPEKFASVGTLTKLGTNLGFCFVTDGGDEIEAISKRPFPDLYATPDGHCLVVVQSQRHVIALAWGGALGVFGRGIDG